MGLDSELRDKYRPFLFLHPAFLLGFSLGLSFLLNYLWPHPLRPLQGLTQIIGSYTCFLSACLIGMLSFKVLRRNKTTAEQSEPTQKIVTEGPYRFSRNPLYISLILVFIAFGFLTASAWAFLLAPLVFLFLHFVVVLPEERYLNDKFGEEYDNYRANVRRWL